MQKKPRTYALAAIALAAVFVALSPLSAPTAYAQQRKAATTKKLTEQEWAQKAFDFANEGKYEEAIKEFSALQKEYGTYWKSSGNSARAALVDYQIGACYLAQKKWDDAERIFKAFVNDYPRDERITDVRLSLVTCFLQKEDWTSARGMIDTILKWLENNPNQGLQMKAIVARAELLQKEGAAKDKAGEKPPEGVESNERYALSLAESDLFKAQNNSIWTPEMIAVRQKLVSIYMKTGNRAKAAAMKAKIDGYLSGKGGELDPASQIRMNMQNLEVGDDYFQQAQAIDTENGTPEELAQREELFRQALQVYQGISRKEALLKCFTPAIDNTKQRIERLKKRGGETPSESIQKRIDKAESDLEELESYKAGFDENKDFDALISFRIGASLLSLNRAWEANVAFNDIIENHKDFELKSTAQYLYILTLRSMGRDDEAQKKCKEFIETYKGDKEKGEELGRVALLMGQISFDRGDYKDAIAQLQWVKAMDGYGKLPVAVRCQIDWFIIAATFSRSPWGILTDDEKVYIKDIGKPDYKPKLSQESQKTMALIDDFIKAYGDNRDFSSVVEEMYYRKALLYFYSTMLPETRTCFEDYISKYPEGLFVPDANYRLAVVQNGVRPPQTQDVIRRCTGWIETYFNIADDNALLDESKVPALRDDVSVNISDSVLRQLPEVYTLLGDANKTLAESVRGSDVRQGLRGQRIESLTKNDIKKKQAFIDKSISAYILAAKSARDNPDALYFSLTELDKQLPQLENGYERLLDLYDTLYKWDPDSPEGLGYLYKKISYTEKKAIMERRSMDKEEGAKHVAKAAEEAKKMMADAIIKNINNPRQDSVEALMGDLAARFAKNVKRKLPLKDGEIPPPADPKEYTAEKAIDEMLDLLHLKDDANATLIARARGAFAKTLVYECLLPGNVRNPAEYDRIVKERDRVYRSIAATFHANELSPKILSTVGTFLAEHGDTKKAEEYFTYVLDFYKGSDSAEESFFGEGKILFERKEYAKAYEIFNEALESNVVYNREPDLRIGRAETLIEMSDKDASSLNISDKLTAAETELNYVKGIKEWRSTGATAAALYNLGRIKELRKQYEAAIGDYRLCFISWKKFPEYAAPAMLRAALIFRDRLSDPEAARTQLLQLTDPTGRFVNTPAAKEAAKLLQSM